MCCRDPGPSNNPSSVSLGSVQPSWAQGHLCPCIVGPQIPVTSLPQCLSTHQGHPQSLADGGCQDVPPQIPLTAGAPAAHADPAGMHTQLPPTHRSPPAAAHCDASLLPGWTQEWSTLNPPMPNPPPPAFFFFCDHQCWVFVGNRLGLRDAAPGGSTLGPQSPLPPQRLPGLRLPMVGVRPWL